MLADSAGTAGLLTTTGAGGALSVTGAAGASGFAGPARRSGAVGTCGAGWPGNTVGVACGARVADSGAVTGLSGGAGG
ncbi:MAG TPA: hypothetical protein VK817_02980 [Trebonia sp.]|nr:hypothetical protein [Trebonia sp.]